MPFKIKALVSGNRERAHGYIKRGPNQAVTNGVRNIEHVDAIDWSRQRVRNGNEIDYAAVDESALVKIDGGKYPRQRAAS